MFCSAEGRYARQDRHYDAATELSPWVGSPRMQTERTGSSMTLKRFSMSITLFLSALLIGLGVLVGNGMRTSVEVARVRQITQARRRRRSR
jgi:hypothetical protein